MSALVKKKAAIHLKAVKKMEAFKEKHAAIFEKYEEILGEIQDSQEELKVAAREEFEGDETKMLLNSPEISVEVRPTHTQPVFSVAKAKKYWPEEAFAQCRKVLIDNKEVAELAKAGILVDKLLKKAVSEEPELKTKAVYIKVKGVS